jgi:hypothetical protein
MVRRVWKFDREILESSGLASGVVEHQADQRLSVVDLVCCDERKGFGELEAEDLNVFVGFGGCCAFADTAGKVDLHPLAQEAGAGKIFRQERPVFGAVAGLFDQLTFGSSKRSFFRFDAAGGKFDQELAGGVAVLALEDDVGVGRVFRLVNGKDDDGTVVADDIAGVDVTAGLFDLVGEDREDFAFICELRGDEPGFGGWLFAGGV